MQSWPMWTLTPPGASQLYGDYLGRAHAVWDQVLVTGF